MDLSNEIWTEGEIILLPTWVWSQEKNLFLEMGNLIEFIDAVWLIMNFHFWPVRSQTIQPVQSNLFHKFLFWALTHPKSTISSLVLVRKGRMWGVEVCSFKVYFLCWVMNNDQCVHFTVCLLFLLDVNEHIWPDGQIHGSASEH